MWEIFLDLFKLFMYNIREAVKAMILSDYHVHTTYCDGEHSLRENVISAIEKGMKTIGFSTHSYTDFDERYCISKENTIRYIEEIAALKKEFAGKINILCGIEKDCYSKADTSAFDYVIGSVHYIKCGDEYIEVDACADILKNAAAKYFGNDMLSLAEAYFETVSLVPENTGCNIVGHFDVITKFNEKTPLFDESHPRYIAARNKAIDKLLTYSIPFEINTGGISRGYKTIPYPAPDACQYIASKNGSFIMSSDSHSKENLMFEFDKWEAEAKSSGLTLIDELV